MDENPTMSDLVKMLLEHRDGIFGFVFALTHDREAAEEIFQEVGLAVVQEAQAKTRVEKFLPWVHEMARRRVAEYYRKHSRRGMERLDSLDEVVGQAFEENAIDTKSQMDRQEHLNGCLEDLPRTQREMIERRYGERASIREIARSMEWTDGAVKVALWKARRRLEGCINGKLGHE